MKLIRTATEPAPSLKKEGAGEAIDRRTFLKRSGVLQPLLRLRRL